MRGLADKGVLVSGGTRGIGLAAVRRFAEEGCRVHLLGPEADAVDEALRSLAAGPRVSGSVCDVRDADQVRSAVAEAEEQAGPLTVLANNAGISNRAAFTDLSVEEWDQLMSVNLRGMFLMAQEFVRLVIAHGRSASVVNMASTNALGGEEDYAHYNASKGGVLQLTRSMAVELGQHGIRVNALCPGYIDTPLNREIASSLKDGFVEQYVADRIPLRRVGSEEDIAAAYAFLASDDAAFVTGSALVVDGGQLAVM